MAKDIIKEIIIFLLLKLMAMRLKVLVIEMF